MRNFKTDLKQKMVGESVRSGVEVRFGRVEVKFDQATYANESNSPSKCGISNCTK